MKHETLKQFILLTISSIGLYFSGLNLITMSNIKSLLDGLNVMIFFSCFFPFLFLSINLLIKVTKATLKIVRFEMLHFKSTN